MNQVATEDRGWRLDGKVGLVTGAASGLGYQSARLLAERGAQVVAVDINASALERAVDEMRTEGLNVSGAVADMREPDAIASLYSEVLSTADRIDFVHNNAGALVANPLLRVEPAEVTLMCQLNIVGTFWSCRYAVEAMRRSGFGGSIVNTASILAHRGDPILPVYTATKHAVLGLTKALAVDPDVAQHGIRVNCVSPGDMDTPMNDHYFDSQENPAAARAALEAIYPGGRMAQPREMATAVAFLVSDDSSFISGLSLVVDAGLTQNAY